MSAPQLFQSTDPNAPGGITYNAGTLVAMLDACLVNGYSTFSVTSITRGGSTATVTATSHGLVTGETVRIAGAAQTEYNVDAVITKIDANTFTYAVGGTPATPATGTITGRKAPAGGGWTIAYTGTNKRAYRAPSGNRFFLRIDDTAAATIDARLRGYETMSDIDTGTGPFPTDAQNSGGGYAYRTDASTARGWKVLADSRAVWWWTDGAGGLGSTSQVNGFGDFISYKVGDAYNSFLACGAGTAAGTAYWIGFTGSPPSTTYNGLVLTRNFSQAGGSVIAAPLWNEMLSSSTFGQNAWITVGPTYAIFPEPINGGLLIDRAVLFETVSKGLRGYLPGLWASYPSRPFSHGDSFNGTGTYAGKQFMQWNVNGPTSVLMELTDWWL